MGKTQQAAAGLRTQSVKKRYPELDLIRVIAVFMITLNHAVNRAYDNYDGQIEEYAALSGFENLVKAFATVISHYGVPLFLMVTGALILDRFSKEEDIVPFYKKNLLHLFLTTEIWYFLMFWILLFTHEDYQVLRGLGIGQILLELVKTMLFVGTVSYSSMWYMPIILCLYLMIPFFGILLKKVAFRKILIPCAAVFVFAMVVPNLEDYLWVIQSEELAISPQIYSSSLFCYHMLAILLGHWLMHKKKQYLKTPVVILLTVGCTALLTWMQLWYYRQEADYVIGYDFPLILITAALLFESVRRVAVQFRIESGLVTYLARISMGIYLVHIIIMEYVDQNYDFFWMRNSEKMLLLWIGSFVASVLIITATKWIKPVAKYGYHMK